MKFTKYSVLAASLMFASGVFADAANVLISFSTDSDVYADGTPVLDGEWYALVWSADGNFEGLNNDCSPVDANDLVVFTAPLAKGGRCPFTVFQIDSTSPMAKIDGEYAVYLLDTRNAGKTAPAVMDEASRKPLTEVVSAVKSATSTAGTSGSFASAEAAAVASGSEKWAVSDNVIKISGFKVVGAQVKITVSGMLPGINYGVKMGPALDQLSTSAISGTTDKRDSEVDFYVEPGNAKFFQVIRK